MSRRCGFTLLTASLLSTFACTPEPDVSATVPAAPVVVYAAYEDRSYLPALFDEYTKQTGVNVIVRNGGAETIVDDIIADNISPPADVLLTSSVNSAWRAAEEGALRPTRSEIADEQVAAWLRDPDSYWTAWSYWRAVLVYGPASIDVTDLDDFVGLADPRFKDRLCLASSADSISLAVIATLIDDLGVHEAELAVRGWIANLAAPVFDTELQLLEGIASGKCAVGLVSSTNFALAAASDADIPVRPHEPATVVVDVEAMGVTRHARNPDGARKLIEWMLDDHVQAQHAAAVFVEVARMDIKDAKNVSRVAQYRDDARKLAERARYR